MKIRKLLQRQNLTTGTKKHGVTGKTAVKSTMKKGKIKTEKIKENNETSNNRNAFGP